MAEWHLPPDYIINNWTEELLNLMIEKLSERRRQINEAVAKAVPIQKANRAVSDKTLFGQLGEHIRTIKKHAD